MPVANTLGMGGGRLKLPRPSGAFFSFFRDFERFPFFQVAQAHCQSIASNVHERSLLTFIYRHSLEHSARRISIGV
jgi:hypothetical protein